MKKQFLTIAGLLGLVAAVTLTSVVFASEATGTLTTGVQGGTGVEGTVVSAPAATPAAGTYTSTQSVSLAASGSTGICYTTNGTTPVCAAAGTSCTTGTLYSSAISVSSSATVKAISCYPNSNVSTVASHAYTINTATASVGGGGSYSGTPFTATTPSTATTTTSTTSTSTSTTGTSGTSSTGTTSGSSTAQRQQLLAQLISTLRALLIQAQAMGIPLPAGTEKFLSGTSSTGAPVVKKLSAISASLLLNSKGEDVKLLQNFLIAQDKGSAANNLAKFGATGNFGSVTKNALLEWQKAVGIPGANGVFGPATKAYLKSIGQ